MFEECDTLSMSEAQAFLVLPKFLTGTASGQYRAARNSSRSWTQRITSWPEAIQYFLRTYTTTTEIWEAVVVLYTTKQKVRETDLAFSTRLNLSSYRCYNVHSDVEKMNIFIDGLHGTTWTIAARQREIQSGNNLTYELLVQFSREESEA